MHTRGFGFPGQGFYSLKIPRIKKQNQPDNVGNLQILSGIAPAAKVEEELKHLVDAKWEWKVKQVDRDNYIVVFPNKMIFDTFSRFGSIELAIHKISAKVSKSDLDLEVTRRLQIGWVKLFLAFLLWQDQRRWSDLWLSWLEK